MAIRAHGMWFHLECVIKKLIFPSGMVSPDPDGPARHRYNQRVIDVCAAERQTKLIMSQS